MGDLHFNPMDGQRLPKLALATDKPEYRQSLALRGLTTLLVAF